MKKTVLRIFALVLALAMCFALAACKPSSGGASSSEEMKQNTDDGLNNFVDWEKPVDLGEVETIVDESGEPYVTPLYNMRDKSVSFLSHWNAETPDSVHMIAYMEKYGGPNLQFLTYSYGECGMKLQAMVLAENSPDVYKLRAGDLTSLLFADCARVKVFFG